MIKGIKVNSIPVYTRYHFNGKIRTKVVIVKNIKTVKPGFIAIPKPYLAALGTLLFFFSIVFISACVILLNPKPAANFLGNCQGRSCFPNLGLKCKDNICQCESNQYFNKKCFPKKNDGSFCSISNQCAKDLICLNGKCQCNSNKYWTGLKCLPSKSHRENCTHNECNTKAYLYCDTTLGLCLCNDSRFWTNYSCFIKRDIGKFCSKNSNCNTFKNLECINGICKLINRFLVST
jgi:hypothetical protein